MPDPTLPIKVDPNIQSAYVEVQNQDVIYANFNVKKLFTKPNTDIFFTNSICSLTANINSSTSGYFHSIRNTLHLLHFQDSPTGLTASTMGIFTFNKKSFDTNIVSLTATATGTNAGNYYSNGSGSLVYETTFQQIGNVLEDYGLLVATASDFANTIGQSITSITYEVNVHYTELNVFCRCQPNELNYSLNPSVFSLDRIGYNYFGNGLTADTENAIFRSDLTSSGTNFSPFITSVGLYDNENNLLAVAKLSRPMRKSTDVPITFRLKIDI